MPADGNSCPLIAAGSALRDSGAASMILLHRLPVAKQIRERQKFNQNSVSSAARS